jgi:peroxiredoxin
MPTVFLTLLIFALSDTAGILHHQDEWAKSRAVVIFFMTTDCPLSNSYIPEINRIRAEYADRGVTIYAVQTDTTISDAEVRKHTADFRLTFPVLLDPTQILVRLVGATVTPQVAVLSSDGVLKYLGRIDNRIADFDKRRPAATRSDLRDALDAVLSGKPVAQPRTDAVGCYINLRKAVQP